MSDQRAYIIPPGAVRGASVAERNADCRLYTVSRLKYPLACRPYQDDPFLLKNIFEEEEYRLPIENFDPKFIIDCGANVGYSAVYFAVTYPNAKIIAVEPEAVNFKMLEGNAMFYDQITCLHSAIWDKEAYIKVVDDYNSTAGFTTVETTADDPQALKATSIGRLLEGSGFDRIDLLKIDIEGAEKEVFEAVDVDDWLSRTTVIAIELHDRVKRGCSSAMFRALARYDFYLALNGENLIFIREDYLN